MINRYKPLIALSGLSIAEAAEFHAVSEASVKSWSSGRRTAPDGIVSEISGLIRKQRDAAITEVWRIMDSVRCSHGTAFTHTIEIAITNEAARANGWHSLRSQDAALARIIAEQFPACVTLKFTPQSGPKEGFQP
jgi:hypothetical protein